MSADLVVNPETETVPALWVCRIRYRAYGPDVPAPQCMVSADAMGAKHRKAGCGYYRLAER